MLPGGLEGIGLDSDNLLDILNEKPKNSPVVSKPQGTFVFGRSKTPELKNSRSQANISVTGFDSSKKTNKSKIEDKPVLGVVSQSVNNFNGVLKDANKRISKQGNAPDFVSRNKEALANIPQKSVDKSENNHKPRNKQYESVTPKYLDIKPSVPAGGKENIPKPPPKQVAVKQTNIKDTNFESSKDNLENKPTINRNQSRGPTKDAYVSAGANSQRGSLSQRRRTELGSYSSRNNVPPQRSKSPIEKQVQPAPPIVEEVVPKKIDAPKISTLRDTPRVNASKPRDKSTKREYKPETKDLFSRLNDYSKFKENCEKLCQSEEEEESIIFIQQKNKKNQSKEKANAEEFLKKQIIEFKENSPKKKRTPAQSSIDLQRVSQPRLKKQAVQIANECSFQPMLSKKSLAIVQKNGYSRDNLYQSRTPKKAEPDQEESESYKPKLCQKSKYIDQVKRRLEMPRHEMLSRMVNSRNHRARNTLTERSARPSREN